MSGGRVYDQYMEAQSETTIKFMTIFQAVSLHSLQWREIVAHANNSKTHETSTTYHNRAVPAHFN